MLLSFRLRLLAGNSYFRHQQERRELERPSRGPQELGLDLVKFVPLGLYVTCGEIATRYIYWFSIKPR